MKCFECEGKGYLSDWVEAGGWYEIKYDCFECEGAGDISLWHFIHSKFWRNAPIWFVEWYADWRYPAKESQDEQRA